LCSKHKGREKAEDKRKQVIPADDDAVPAHKPPIHAKIAVIDMIKVKIY
jgi:hypothetical protein